MITERLTFALEIQTAIGTIRLAAIELTPDGGNGNASIEFSPLMLRNGETIHPTLRVSKSTRKGISS